jgi:rhodanese-related sulfurtransferase
MKRRNLMTGFLALGIALATAAIVSAQSLEWMLVNWKVRHDFPNVRRISPEEVAQWLKDPKRAQPVLLDVRTKAEFDVSHIHGARRIEPGSAANAIDLARDTPIVTYCSVGYRSGAFAKKLQDAGYQNVENMSGSIFQWANEGRPVERAGQRVEKVHPYDARWGKLLKPSLRADVPPAGKGM